jgi:hypothetical protein
MNNLIFRAIKKLIFMPLKYKKGDDYNAEKYWQNRFEKYDNSLKGIGHEGLSHKKNKKMYKQAKNDFINLLNELN